MVESEKNPGRPQTETEDVGLKAERERLALVTTKRSERMTNYSLACSPQVIIREVKFKLFLRVTGVTGLIISFFLSQSSSNLSFLKSSHLIFKNAISPPLPSSTNMKILYPCRVNSVQFVFFLSLGSSTV